MDLFDVIGPVMIGPSSSHTAGAARIGRVARRLLGEPPVRAVIDLHGSFAKTWQGHGTDRALVGGLMDMAVDDPRLREARALARAAGMVVVFRTVRLKNAHPNTVVIRAAGASGREISVQAASVGGGSILVQSLDGLEVGFSGEADTLIVCHQDSPGVIAGVSRVLAEAGHNIAAMRVFRKEPGGDAVMALEMDAPPGATLVETLRALARVKSVTLLQKN